MGVLPEICGFKQPQPTLFQRRRAVATRVTEGADPVRAVIGNGGHRDDPIQWANQRPRTN